MWWNLIYWIVLGVSLAYSLFTEKGREGWGWFFNNFVAAAIKQASPLLDELAPAIEGILAGYVTNIERFGPAIKKTIVVPIGNLVANNYAEATANLTAAGESTPTNATDQAAAAFKQAMEFGISSAAVTAGFEALFPEKLNSLNSMGPALAGMAGYEEVSKAVLEPLYKNAFKTSLEYKYRALFKPEYPDEDDAVKWHSRRLLTEAQLKAIFEVSGLKPEYEDAYVTSAYRPVPPFLLARAAEIGAIPKAALMSALQFGGFRQLDIDFLIQAYDKLALLPYENAYLAALKRSAELGVITMADLVDAMNTIGLNFEMQTNVQLEVATRKLEQLTEIYRKSVSEAYRYGTISDADYVPALEAIGIDYADANAHYQFDSTIKSGKAAAAALKAEQKLERERQSAAIKAANANFKAGNIDAVALGAAYLAAGMDAEVAANAVIAQEARQQGAMVLAYGLELPHGKAVLLHEKVTALGKQLTARLITPAFAHATLASLGVPAANAEALVASWMASHTSSTGRVLEPI